MIVCSNCKHLNMAGAMFCSECGAQLTSSDSLTTQNIQTDQIRESIGPDVVSAVPPTPTTVTVNAWGTLHLVDTGQILPLTDRNEYTLGRISEGQPIMPDIDLSPYQAYASGVSRMHAVLKWDGEKAIIMDLGSSNGTYLNGKRLAPNVEYPIHHGDLLALGKLKIHILLRNAS